MFLADPGFWTPLDLLADKVCAPIHWYSLYLFLLVVTVVIYVHYTYSWRKSIHPVMLYMNTNRMTQAKLAHGEIQTRRQLITTHMSTGGLLWIVYHGFRTWAIPLTRTTPSSLCARKWFGALLIWTVDFSFHIFLKLGRLVAINVSLVQ